MQYFSDNKRVNFNILRQSGIYSEVLIDEIKQGNYNVLEELIDDKYREDKDFMEPILYAVRNEYNTYSVYKYYGKKLQEDINLAKEIIKEEPELIYDTSVSDNKQFILEIVEINPEIIQHISQSLKEDSVFIESLCELENKEVMIHVAKECKIPETIIDNPNLAENKIFMGEIIKENPETLEYASDDLKDDYEFMKEVSKDKETIEYVVEHTHDFGEEGLTGTKEALIELSSNEAILGFEEEQESLKKQIDSDNKEEKLEELLKRDKQLQRHIKFFEKIKNGEVDPIRAAKLIDKFCVNLNENYKKEIKQMLKLDEAILEKQKENILSEEQEKKINNSDVEEITKDASLEGIKEETEIIRREITNERNNLEQRTNDVGEKTNEDDGERA